MLRSWVKAHRPATIILAIIALFAAGAIAFVVSQPSPTKVAPASRSVQKTATPSRPPMAYTSSQSVAPVDKSLLAAYPTMPDSQARDTSPVPAENKTTAVDIVKAYYSCDATKDRAPKDQTVIDNLSDSVARLRVGANTSECAQMLQYSPQYTNDVRQLTAAKYTGRFGAIYQADILQVQVTYDETVTYTGDDGTLTTDHLKDQQTTMYVFLAHQPHSALCQAQHPAGDTPSTQDGRCGVTGLYDVEVMGI